MPDTPRKYDPADASWYDDLTDSAPEAGVSFNVGEALDDRELDGRERYAEAPGAGEADEMADPAAAAP